MSSPAQNIANILDDEDIGTFATDIFVSKEPILPDECITVFDTGGFPPEPSFKYDYPTVQIRIRGKKNGYVRAYTKAESIKTLLNGKSNYDVDSVTRIVGIWAMGDIMLIGYDEKERPLLTINFRIQRTE